MKVLLVPSCGISPVNQLTPTDTLLRCQRALKLWQSGKYDKILVSGGIFLPPQTQTKAAGVLMAEWLVSHGVPRRALIIEGRSVDTFGNIKFSLDRLKEINVGKAEITVVTQWQHAVRFWISFFFGYGLWVKLHFMRYPISLRTWLKEWFLIIYHLYDPIGIKKIARKNREQRRQISYKKESKL